MKLEGAKVLVTGAGGFIGSHLAEALVERGATVRALCKYNSMGSWGWLEGSPYVGEIDCQLGDVRDAQCCDMLIRDVDVVFNLAALIGIPYSYRAPSSYIETNVNGALHVCQAALNHDARVIQMSTSEVYGSALYTPIDEKHPLQPQSPYSASKIGADALALSFNKSFGLEVTLARPFNTYGPRQSLRAVIPTIISQLVSGKTTINLGSLDTKRDFNFVADTARGLMLVAECDEAVGKALNIGSGKNVTIGELAQCIADIVGVEVTINVDDQRIRPKNSEVDCLLSDNTLSQTLCGYAPQVSLEEGLSKTIEWFSKSEYAGKTKEQIYHV